MGLSASQSENVAGYLNLLLAWNARMNLTAVREPEEMITRHFGESFFSAQKLLESNNSARDHIIDVGSGAGFPGLPVKIWAPEIQLTLIESNQKKATFLREVVRKLGLTHVAVFGGRAKDFKAQADIVTLRAVERFERAVVVAVRLVRDGGHLALLIGKGQVKRAKELAPNFEWRDPIAIPLSSNRTLLIGRSGESQNQPG